MSLSQRFPFRDVTSEYFLAILSLHRRCASMKRSALSSFYPRNDRVKNIVYIPNGSAGFVSGHDRMSRSGTFARDRRVRSLKNPMRRVISRRVCASNYTQIHFPLFSGIPRTDLPFVSVPIDRGSHFVVQRID